MPEPKVLEAHLIDSDSEGQQFYWWVTVSEGGHFAFEARESIRQRDPVVAVVWPEGDPGRWWFEVGGYQDWRRTPVEARRAAEDEWERQAAQRARDYRDAVRGVDRG